MRLCSLGLGLGGIHNKARFPGGEECWLFIHLEGRDRQMGRGMLDSYQDNSEVIGG